MASDAELDRVINFEFAAVDHLYRCSGRFQKGTSMREVMKYFHDRGFLIVLVSDIRIVKL